MKRGELVIRYDFTTQPKSNELNAALINVAQKFGYNIVSAGGGQEPGVAVVHGCIREVQDKRRVVPAGSKPEGTEAAKKRAKAEARAAAKAAKAEAKAKAKAEAKRTSNL